MAFLPLPSFALAVIVTVLPLPAFLAVTTPFELTVAYFLLLLVQATFLLVAFVGVMVVVRVTFFPAFTVLELALILIFVTGLVIFNLKVALLPFPPLAVAVIVIVLPLPAFLAVTTPLLSTVAYLVLLLVHLIVLFASDGLSSAFSWSFLPIATLVDSAVILVTFTTVGVELCCEEESNCF